MILGIFTLFHVLLSLVGIAAGLVVAAGMLSSKRLDGWTSVFLWSTVATSVTGFLFPFHHFMPSHAVGILSLVALAIAIPARYNFGMAGAWRKAYIFSALVALYFNVFVLFAQLFQKVPFLKALAPTQSEPPFLVTQIVVMIVFIVLGVRSASAFRGGTLRTA